MIVAGSLSNGSCYCEQCCLREAPFQCRQVNSDHGLIANSFSSVDFFQLKKDYDLILSCSCRNLLIEDAFKTAKKIFQHPAKRILYFERKLLLFERKRKEKEIGKRYLRSKNYLLENILITYVSNNKLCIFLKLQLFMEPIVVLFKQYDLDISISIEYKYLVSLSGYFSFQYTFRRIKLILFYNLTSQNRRVARFQERVT